MLSSTVSSPLKSKHTPFDTSGLESLEEMVSDNSTNTICMSRSMQHNYLPYDSVQY